MLLRGPLVFARDSVSSPVTMPLSLAYLAASLLEAGHEVSVLDSLVEGLTSIRTSYGPEVSYRGLSNEEIIARIHGRPDAIGITTMFSQEWPHLDEMIRAIHAAYPDVPMIMGGEHATACSEYILRSCPAVKHICTGEGEATVVEYADFLDGKKKIEDVAGIQYLGAAGELVTNPERPRNRTPDDLPWPAWHLFDLEPYFEVGEGMGVARGRSMPILATRGCPYQCTFCSNPTMWTTRYVMRDVRLVLDEIESYMSRYGAVNIDFFDLTAIIKKDWTMDFCREIKRRNLQFTWQLPSGTRSEALDNEVLREMAETGCKNVTYAPESGSVRTLERIKKKVKLPRLIESIKAAVHNGIVVKCNLVIGFPHETRWDMIQTFWLAMRFAWINVDDTGIYVFSPYPGSELHRYLRGKGVVKDDKAYFEALLSFMKPAPAVTFCENVGRNEITFYRLVGMSLFYIIGYLAHPGRILRTIRNIRNLQADTTLETRLTERFRRIGYRRKTAQLAAN